MGKCIKCVTKNHLQCTGHWESDKSKTCSCGQCGHFNPDGHSPGICKHCEYMNHEKCNGFWTRLPDVPCICQECYPGKTEDEPKSIQLSLFE